MQEATENPAVQKKNDELSTALEQAHTEPASSKSDLAERISNLEQRNHQLMSEIEQVQRQFVSLQMAFSRTVGDLEAKKQHLVDLVEGQQKSLDRYPSLEYGPETWQAGTEMIELVVSPFAYFDTINRFINAIQSLSGVKSARARRFQKGTLYLWLAYTGMIPLADRLHEISGFDLVVVNADPRHIQATLQPLKDSIVVDVTSKAEMRG